MPSRLLKLYPIGQTFCGVHLSQTWADLWIWEKVLNEVKPTRIIELGTYDGGFSAFLKVQSVVRECPFYTYDIAQHFRTPYVADNFKQLDLFHNGDEVKSLIASEGPTLLFCDNGDKEREASVFGESLKLGDILAVHDWGTECNNVPGYLTLYYPDKDEGIYEALESPTRFYIR